MPWFEAIKQAGPKSRGVDRRETTAPIARPAENRSELYRTLYAERAALPAEDPRKVDLERVRTFIITSSRVADDDGVLLPDGGDFAQFAANPIVLWGHDTDTRLGRGLDRRRITTPVDGWEMDIEFAPASASEDAEECFRFIEWAGFAACSMRFDVTEGDFRPRPEDIIKYGLLRFGWIGKKWRMKEVSICSLPCDSTAMMHAAQEAGEIGARALATARKWQAREAMPADPMQSLTAAIQAFSDEQRAGFLAIAESLSSMSTSIAERFQAVETALAARATDQPDTKGAEPDVKEEAVPVGGDLYDQILGRFDEPLRAIEESVGIRHA